jgi:hypothetical protein
MQRGGRKTQLTRIPDELFYARKAAGAWNKAPPKYHIEGTGSFQISMIFCKWTLSKEDTEMDHTFLLKEGNWYASGMLWDEHEIEVPIAGHSFIEHREGKWFNHSMMRLLADPPIELKSEYEIEPVPEGKASTVWKSFNPSLGMMAGTFSVVGDSILSSYRSESGEYSGSEYFLMEDDSTYQVKGVLFKGTIKVSSWEAMLTK